MRTSRLQPLARAVLRTQTDDRLVALARESKEAAFEEIVRRYRSALVAFAAGYGAADPEDVVQESLVSSWDALRDSTGEMHLKAWLYTIVRNRALNARRDTRRHEQLSDQIDGVRQPAEIVLTKDELQRVVAAVGALPESQREALVRSALEGHSHEQIAAATGSSPGAVRQLIYRGRLAIRHGVGLVIPFPVVRALAELGAGGATAASIAAGTGAGPIAGGAGAAGGAAGLGGIAGAGSLATKAAVVAVVGAIAAGSGVAIQHARDGGDQSDKAARAAGISTPAPDPDLAPSASTPTIAEAPGPSGREDGSGSSDSSGDGSSGDTGGGAHGSNEPGSGDSDSSSDSASGPGPSADPSGSGESSGSGGTDGDPSGDGSSGSGDSGSSGPGPSGSGSSGSGHSGSDAGDRSSGSVDSTDSGGSGDAGSGSGDDALVAPTPTYLLQTDDWSGSGSGDSVSGGSHSGPG